MIHVFTKFCYKLGGRFLISSGSELIFENSLMYKHCSNLNHEIKLEDAKISIKSSQTTVD